MFGQVIGAALGWAGEKPEAPDFEPINISDVVRTTTGTISANLPAVKDIAADMNQFMAEESVKSIESQFPGYREAMGEYVQNMRSLMGGEVAPGTEDYLQRKGAERAAMKGTVGSQFAWGDTTRSLGLQSYQNVLRGMDAFSRWSQQAQASAKLYNPNNMLPSFGQSMSAELWNKETGMQMEWMKNQLEAMPSPLESAMMESLKQFDDLTWQAAGTAAGMGMGGIGGMGGGGGGSGESWKPADYSGVNPNQYRNMGATGLMY